MTGLPPNPAKRDGKAQASSPPGRDLPSSRWETLDGPPAPPEDTPTEGGCPPLLDAKGWPRFVTCENQQPCRLCVKGIGYKWPQQLNTSPPPPPTHTLVLTPSFSQFSREFRVAHSTFFRVRVCLHKVLTFMSLDEITGRGGRGVGAGAELATPGQPCFPALSPLRPGSGSLGFLQSQVCPILVVGLDVFILS